MANIFIIATNRIMIISSQLTTQFRNFVHNFLDMHKNMYQYQNFLVNLTMECVCTNIDYPNRYQEIAFKNLKQS